MYVVYLDVFFVINYIMDYILLRLTSIIVKKKAGTFRLCAGAAVGAIYSVAALKPLVRHSIYLTILNIIISFVMVWIAFGFVSKKSLIKNGIVLRVVSFFMGGFLNYLYYSTRVGIVINEAIHNRSPGVTNARKFTVVTLLAYLMISLLVKFLRRYKMDEKRYYQIKLIFKGKAVIAEALYDTGNCLVEPVTGKMVHIAQGELIRQLLGRTEAQERMYIIPYQSVGVENGLLYGVRLDEMIIYKPEEEVHIESPVVGIYEGELSVNQKYKVILNSGVF